jgi:predicted DNA-binding transcriptional regulator YafY
MATKSRAKANTLTPDRLTRLYKLLSHLDGHSRERSWLIKKLKMNNTRVFYRDVQSLRTLGIDIESNGDTYSLTGSFDDACDKLPFPDLGLSFAEVQTLSEGRSEVHKKLRSLLTTITGG